MKCTNFEYCRNEAVEGLEICSRCEKLISDLSIEFASLSDEERQELIEE